MKLSSTLALGLSISSVEARTTDWQAVAADPSLRLYGFAFLEKAGSANVINIRHGTADSDALVLPLRLAANEFQGDVWEHGIECPDGIFVEVDSATSMDLVILYKTGN